MQKKLDKVFRALPVSLQNVALSIYGLRLLRNRHAGNYGRYFAEAVDRAAWARERLRKYEDETLVRLLRFATDTVPFYRDLRRRGGFPVEKVRGVADIALLPLLEKAEVRTGPERFVSEAYRLKDLSTISTTGTTGTPLKIYCNADVRQKNYAFHDRFLTMSGINKRGLRATIGGRIVVPAANRSPPFWRYSYFQKNALFSSYHLSEGNIGTYIEKLRLVRPDHIDSYPSSIYTIADYAKRHGVPLRGIAKAIVTSGETLFDDQKAVIEEQFGVCVFDQYGSAEMNVLVTSCDKGTYHIHSDFGVLEILGASGKAATFGEEGEIVCTGFINEVMPLVRYRIGDRAIAGGSCCSCGSTLPTVTRILGRDDDAIITPGGDRVGRLSPVLKGFPVKEAQYIQEEIGEIRVLLVVDSSYDSQDENRLARELRLRLGNEIGIRFEHVDRIERGKGGKLKSIVSKLKRPQ